MRLHYLQWKIRGWYKIGVMCEIANDETNEEGSKVLKIN